MELKELVKSYPAPFHTVFIGGGNPGMLSGEDLLELCRQCTRRGRPMEFSIEINPESIGSWIEPSLEYIDRISMGIQTLDSRTLSILGRNTSLSDTLAGIEISQKLRRKHDVSINYDFITCVPGIEPLQSEKDIERIFQLADFDHLSLYALQIEQGTQIDRMVRSKELVPMDDDDQASLLSYLWSLFHNRGMQHYEVSNFAFNGHRCLHNMVYWDMGQYFGLGPGAASTVYSPYGRIECNPDLEAYVQSPPWSGYTSTALSKVEQFEEWAIMGCRTVLGLSSEDCMNRFGFALPELQYPGFSMSNGVFCPENDGFLLSDGAAAYVVSKTLK